MAGPFMLRKGNPIAVVLDNSAVMQVRTASGKTRFETAVAKLRDALGAAGDGGAVTVYLTAPQPHSLGDAFPTVTAATSAVELEHPIDAPEDPAAVTGLLTQLGADRHLGHIIFVSYRGIAPAAPARVIPITVGVAAANYAIGAFVLSRESFATAALDARLSVANFAPEAQTIKATITGNGAVVGSAEAKVDAGAVATLDFPKLAPAEVYRAQVEPSDAFALDNYAYATRSAVKPVAILFISPVPADGEALKSIPGVAVTTRAPAAYSPKDLAESDLAIYEYTLPKELPAQNSLLVMPPAGDPVFGFVADQAARLDITGWPTTDQLTDGVNFRLLNIRSGEYFANHPWMQPVVSGSAGGLMIAGSRRGHRFVATGFNPFPYLGRQNLPMSILTLNLLGYLAGFGAQSAGYRTGEPWIVPAGVTAIVLPSGRKQPVHAGDLYSAVTEQGVYTLIGAAGTKSLRAANLADLTASDLENVPAIRLEAAVGDVQTSERAVRTPLQPYILAAIIALITLEGVIVYRRRRPALALQT
jgi:hypothetical protein